MAADKLNRSPHPRAGVPQPRQIQGFHRDVQCRDTARCYSRCRYHLLEKAVAFRQRGQQASAEQVPFRTDGKDRYLRHVVQGHGRLSPCGCGWCDH